VPNETGLLVRTEGEFASAWAALTIDHRRREAMGQAARDRALRLHWSAAVDGFSDAADEAIARARVADQAEPAVLADPIVADPVLPAPSEPA
jgi:hypothetical protein